MNCCRFYYRTKGLFKVNAKLLEKIFSNKTWFSSLNRAIGKLLSLKDPFAGYNMHSLRCRNKRTSMIGREGIKFFCHCIAPLRIFLCYGIACGCLKDRDKYINMCTRKRPFDSAMNVWGREELVCDLIKIEYACYKGPH